MNKVYNPVWYDHSGQFQVYYDAIRDEFMVFGDYLPQFVLDFNQHYTYIGEL